MQIRTYTDEALPQELRLALLDFLYEHLEEFGDEKEDIALSLDYISSKGKGGHVLLAEEEGKLLGAVIVNKTGMTKYIPENILVYIATHNEARGKGIGKKLMEETINRTSGSIALHCEPNNPAKHLYEKFGFTSKYLEMRLAR